MDCLFCKVISGEIPSSKVYEDEHCFAFNDIDPQAPTHILIIPKRHINSLDKAGAEDLDLLGRLMITAAGIARDKGFNEDGYRIVNNVNSDGGQTVFHLHLHLLAGRQFVFPPG